jgi:hypothetical protein
MGLFLQLVFSLPVTVTTGIRISKNWTDLSGKEIFRPRLL